VPVGHQICFPLRFDLSRSARRRSSALREDGVAGVAVPGLERSLSSQPSCAARRDSETSRPVAMMPYGLLLMSVLRPRTQSLKPSAWPLMDRIANGQKFSSLTTRYLCNSRSWDPYHLQPNLVAPRDFLCIKDDRAARWEVEPVQRGMNTRGCLVITAAQAAFEESPASGIQVGSSRKHPRWSRHI